MSISFAPIKDISPTDDEALDALRQATITELGRQLRPAESFALAQGLPLPGDDGLEAPQRLPSYEYNPLSPEDVFREAAESGRT